MEEIINQNEHCYDWIIDNSGNGIAIIIDKQISYANSTAVNILGAKNLDDLKGRRIYDFIGGNSLKSLRFTNQKNNYEHNEIIIKNLNNELINAEFNVNKINYRNKSAQLLIIKDISYRNEIKTLKNELSVSEDQLNKTNEHNKMLTEFFSNISHELKTPINVILSAVQLLICQSEEPADNFNEKLSLLLNVVKQNGYRLIRLVNNLWDISKYDSGYMKLEIHNYNIVNIVEEITLSVAEYIESKGVTLLFDTDTEERIMAVDADKIERIMLNLLSNAVKFTNDGDEITVTIKDNEDYVSVCVKDTGIGIPEDKLKMIFDRFAQIDKTLIRNKEGSGIGLSLV
ncbi:ATP-binding protein [Sedimentibacter sp.]|uniref:sensor histidine kinase n=1 Tax=Sedimentibacter sp. TaxID=1960295 RepID=UPI0037DA1338